MYILQKSNCFKVVEYAKKNACLNACKNNLILLYFYLFCFPESRGLNVNH